MNVRYRVDTGGAYRHAKRTALAVFPMLLDRKMMNREVRFLKPWGGSGLSRLRQQQVRCEEFACRYKRSFSQTHLR